MTARFGGTLQTDVVTIISTHEQEGLIGIVDTAYLQSTSGREFGTLESYTREDELFDQLERLPSEEQVRRLVELLPKPFLKTLSEGLLIDGVEACKALDIMLVAKALNSWVATAEETIASRRRRRYIQAARAEGRRSIGAE